MPITWTTHVNIMGSSVARQALAIGTSGRWSTGVIDLSSYHGAQIVFDLKSSSTAATCKNIEYAVYGGLSTLNIDDVALFSAEVTSSPNPSQVSVVVSGIKYARVKVTQSSSNDSHEAWVNHARWRST